MFNLKKLIYVTIFSINIKIILSNVQNKKNQSLTQHTEKIPLENFMNENLFNISDLSAIPNRTNNFKNEFEALEASPQRRVLKVYDEKSNLDFLQENFDFNPDDLEDFQENGTFEETERLLNEKNNDTLNLIARLGEEAKLEQHVYKVPKPKSNIKQKQVDYKTRSIDSQQLKSFSVKYSQKEMVLLNVFQIFTNLFDHSAWNISEIVKSVSTKCGLDMFQYLTDLNKMEVWALKGKV